MATIGKTQQTRRQGIAADGQHRKPGVLRDLCRKTVVDADREDRVTGRKEPSYPT
jgi:hypothetical protein